MFQEKLDVKLIRLVKDNPVLYDYNHEKYMDFNSREVAWQKIGDEMKKPAVDCKIRWINIRDVHRRILRKNLSAGKHANKVYKYEKELRFMRQHYKDVVAAPSLNYDEEEKGNDWQDMQSDNNDLPEPSCSEEDSDKPIKKKVQGKRRKPKKRPEISYVEEEKQASSTFNETQTISDFDVTDPVDAFLLSIGATLKTFSPYHLNVAKSKIFSVVQEHDLQQIVQKERHELTDVKSITSDDNMFIT